MEKLKTSLSAQELAECLGLTTVQGVYKALKAHDIPSDKAKNGRKIIPPKGVRKLFEARGLIYPKKIVSFQIVKGGVGKTSLSFCLAVRASHYGARVLVIDMDQQGSLTSSFNVDARDKPVWINLYRDKTPVESALVKLSDNLHLIPSNLNNSRLDMELTQSSVNLKDTIRDTIAPIRDHYDLIVIDCPPAINKINTAVTCASDLVLIPLNPDPYSMDGLDFTISELNQIKKDFKLNVDYQVVFNKYDGRERLSAFYMHEVAKRADLVNKVLPVVCRVDASLKNAIFDSKSIFDLPKKKSPIREDIDLFAKEILGINTWKEKRKSEECLASTIS